MKAKDYWRMEASDQISGMNRLLRDLFVSLSLILKDHSPRQP